MTAAAGEDLPAGHLRELVSVLREERGRGERDLVAARVALAGSRAELEASRAEVARLRAGGQGRQVQGQGPSAELAASEAARAKLKKDLQATTNSLNLACEAQRRARAATEAKNKTNGQKVKTAKHTNYDHNIARKACQTKSKSSENQ